MRNTVIFAAVIVALVGCMSLLVAQKRVHAAGLSTDDFVTTWKTDNPGITNSSSVDIRFDNSGPYDIDWNNDGIFDDINVYGATHDYGTPGTYTIRIRSHGGLHFITRLGDAGKLVSVDQWGTTPWISMADAFNGASNMVVNATDVPNLSQVTDMSNAFDGAALFNPSNISSWDVSHVTKMYYTFDGAASFNQDISSWDVSNVTDMTQLFAGARSFNQPLASWNTSKVTDMTALFANAAAFNQDISTWNTSNVVSMGGMFGNATSFNQNISSWNISKVTSLQNMFSGATSFNQPIGGLNVSSVTNMVYMFQNATAFNQNISSWDVSHVTDMLGMFQGATSFNQSMNGWNTSQLTNMTYMFNDATSFNQDISYLNTSNVTSMDSMFRGAVSFKQPLGSLNVSKVQYMNGVVDGSGYGASEYDATIRGWSAQTLQPNVGTTLSYCTAGAERESIIQTYNWSIYGSQMCFSQFTSEGLLAGTSKEVANASATQNSLVSALTSGGLTLDAVTPYSLNCAQQTPDNAYFKIGGASGDELHFKTTLSYDAPQDENHDNTYDICIRTVGQDGQGFDTAFTVTIRPPKRITGASFSVDANSHKVLTVSGQSYFGDGENIGIALTVSLVRLNGVDLKFCSDGLGMSAQEFIDAYSSDFPDIASRVTDAAPCYWLVGAHGMSGVQVSVWLPDDFDTSARGVVSVNGSLAYVFNPGASGDVSPTAEVNGATKPLDQHPTINPLPTFSGVATPGATVTVTVHSDPVTCTTTADAHGNWSCTLSTALPAGEHTVYVQVTNPDSSVENLGPYAVTVGGTITNETPRAPNTGLLNMMALSFGAVVGAAAILVLSVLGVVRFRKRAL